MSKTLLFLAFLFSAIPSVARAEISAARSLAIIDRVRLPAKVENAHERLRDVLSKILSSKGWELIPVTVDADCGEPLECLATVARKYGTDYVLNLGGDSNQELGFDISLELFSAGSSHTQKEKAVCDYCDIERMAQIVSRSAGELLDNALAVKASYKAPPLTKLASVTPRHSVSNPRTIWGPLALMGTGALIVGYGGWLVYRDGESTGTRTGSKGIENSHKYSSKTLGIGALIFGGAVTIFGAMWGILGSQSATSVSVSLNHVELSVRY